MFLEKSNTHERDSHINFQEKGHVYTIDGESGFTSVTKWNHSHFQGFNADKVIKCMMMGPRWSSSQYYGLTPDEIKEIWKQNGNEAALAGTKLHADIEYYYNNLPVENDSIEYSYFLNFAKENSGLKPYRTEWMIWDSELRLAGSIDMVYQLEDGSLMIYDWKRSKNITKSNSFNQWGIPDCLNHVPDTNFWHYSLQLNTYKRLLEKNYGVSVSQLRLVCLHPNNNNYEVIHVPDMSDEIDVLMEMRRQQLLEEASKELT